MLALACGQTTDSNPDTAAAESGTQGADGDGSTPTSGDGGGDAPDDDGQGDGADDNGGPDDGMNDGGMNDGPTNDGESGGDPDGPVILDFSVNTPTLTELDVLIFSVVVTDPDGIDDVIGGTLKAGNGSSYGAFQTASSEGAYELTQTWEQLGTVDEITFDDVEQRSFIAEFFDAAGHSVTQEVTVSLSCSEDAFGACVDGMCQWLEAVDACGSCDLDCTDINLPPLAVQNPDVNTEDNQPWTGYFQFRWCEISQPACQIAVSIEQIADFSCDQACAPWQAIDALAGGDNGDPVGTDQSTSDIGDALLCRCEA